MIVFVSYSSRNRKRIEDLVLQLGQLGHDVQFESKLIGGDVPWQQVFDSIATCDLFVATLTAETLVSYTSRIEHEYARDLNKYILFVALDEISTLTDLDPQVRENAVDFSKTNPHANEALANALSSFVHLEPQLATGAPPPSWNPALEDLDRRVNLKNADAGEQAAVLLNLGEFLERHETFMTTRNLLAAFVDRSDLRPDIRRQSRRMLGQARHIGSLLQKIQRRGIFYAAVIVSLLVSLAIVLLSQVVLQFRAQRGATARLTSTALTLRADTATFTPAQTQPASATTVAPLATGISSTQTLPSPEVTSTEFAPTTTDNAAITQTVSPEGGLTATPSTAAPVTTNTQIASPISTIATATPIPLITNTPRPVTGTAVAQVMPIATKLPLTVTSTATVKPSSTPTPKPATNIPATIVTTQLPTSTPTLTATVKPKPTSTPTQVPATAAPTQAVALAPTLDLSQILSRNVYIGIDVKDTLFGVQVKTVGATAKSAGIQVDDYILAINLDTIKTRLDFFKVMAMQNPFSNINLRMRRDSQTIEVSLVLGAADFALSNPT